jgi:hypothetical protein
MGSRIAQIEQGGWEPVSEHETVVLRGFHCRCMRQTIPAAPEWLQQDRSHGLLDPGCLVRSFRLEEENPQ